LPVLDSTGGEIGFTGIICLMSLRQLEVISIGICFLPILASACKKSSPASTSIPTLTVTSASPTFTAEPTVTAIPPTATPEPMAAVVNGQGITLAEFQAEVGRFEASTSITGTILASDTNTIVLNELIEQTLLAQAAAEDGYSVDDTLIQTRIETLETQLGGSEALQAWQSAHGFTSEAFASALKRAIAAAWMRDQIIAAVPETAEQVHVLQILVPTQQEADQVYASLESGKDFMDVASTYDPLTKGDLGWFPRGYLSDAAIEEAAFQLQEGQYSAVIHTEVGYHILYILERDAQHPLQPDARKALQLKAVLDWIGQRRENSQIQILVP
jgi:peptidyl-prolyl cis-trans isomerase C